MAKAKFLIVVEALAQGLTPIRNQGVVPSRNDKKRHSAPFNRAHEKTMKI